MQFAIEQMRAYYRRWVPESYRRRFYEARCRFLVTIQQWLYDRVPDRYVQAYQFKRVFGRRLNWNSPSSFNEKIHWIRRYYRHPIMTQLADKYGVREYVADKVGAQFLKDLYGVWDYPAAVDFERLPGSFVLKVTWGSGQSIFCRDRSTLDLAKTRLQLGEWMKRGYYWLFREWAYKNITPRILCEEFLLDETSRIPTDYKFFCFNGEPLFIQVVTNRFSNHRRHIFDLGWKHLPFNIGYSTNCDDIPKPSTLEAMISVGRTLSRGFPFVRVDLYSVGARVIFGEMTWYPDGGCLKFIPEVYDRILGEALILPRRNE